MREDVFDPITQGVAFAGLIDEVELFNRDLLAVELQDIYAAGPAGKCKGAVSVTIDIKPGSDPNCFNINGHGVIPVAILGSADLNVDAIDPNSLLFDGLEVRVRGRKGPMCSEEDANGDSYPDLVCHFEDDADSWGRRRSDWNRHGGTPGRIGYRGDGLDLCGALGGADGMVFSRA